MKYRDHEKELREITRAHTAERQLLLARIRDLEATIEALRARAQRAEQQCVEIDRWWTEEAPIPLQNPDLASASPNVSGARQ